MIVAALIVAALVIGSAGALLQSSDDPEIDPPPASPPPSPSPATTDAAVPVTTELPGPSTTSSSEPPGTVGETAAVAEVAGFTVGEIPLWTERTLVVPDPLASIASTELVTLSRNGIVSVTEFPTGRSRSLDVSALGGGLQLVVGDRAIVVHNGLDVLQLREGEPVVVSAAPDGVVFLEAWTGTDRFILTTPTTGPSTRQQEMVLQPDGASAPLLEALAEEARFWSRSFSPEGDVLVSRPGGVYAIASDGGTRRISTGDLLATGDAHWAIEECDETLRCAYSIVAWDNGEVTPGALDPMVSVASFGFIDPVTRISPDGRSIVHRADTDGISRRRILDVATGSTVEAGRINQFAHPDSWAADSSGIFIVVDQGVEFVERFAGTRTRFEGLDGVTAVATGRAGAPGG